MGELTAQESQMYKLMISDGKTAVDASGELATKGINVTPEKLRSFKKTISAKLDKDMRDERMMENMLESFDRTKLEFEDCVTRVKGYVKKFEEDGKTSEALVAQRELIGMLNTSLKTLGKLNTHALSIKANNVNILNSTDFIDTFRKTLYLWFENQDATVDKGQLIFRHPSPEMLDDYYKWDLTRAKKAVLVDGTVK